MSETLSADTYRVLARKYRPATFGELIGQDALVRTLTNAIESGRLAHAFLLTGVRGVGKTTTARIIARSLNCVGPDGAGGPTATPCGVCENCTAIAADRHVDVIEMDAASRTGVNDIRELIESVRYRPTSARFKIYIIDEVHMLSGAAFNALLKTLEEPPPRVTFIFATTEIRKVPVTVLSRCQRFDLRRVDMAVLTAHFAAIAKQEAVAIDDAALALIARAADGSVRDGLSLLDQAIAHGAGTVEEPAVRDMLGLADGARIFDLFDALMKGDAADAMTQVDQLYDAGADPVAVLSDLLELAHWLTRLKVTPGAGDAINHAETERVRGGRMADALSFPVLARTWQMLLKGLGETRTAPRPVMALEMALLRLVYAASLPTPAETIPALESGEATPGRAAPPTNPTTPAVPVESPAVDPVAVAAPGPVPMAAEAQPALLPEDAPRADRDPEPAAPPRAAAAQPESFADVVALVEAKREIVLLAALESNVHLVRFEPGRIELRLDNAAEPNLVQQLGERLSQWTGSRWVIVVSQEGGEPTLKEQREAAHAAQWAAAEATPRVQAVLAVFPDATLEDVRAPADPIPSDPDGGDDP